MAVIGKIRQRSGLLIFLIGASIVGFLIMDATNSQFSVLKGRKDSVGKVNGEKITYLEYNKKYEENVKNMEEQMRGQPIADDQRNYIRTQTWTELVNDIIFKKIYNQLGINVTPDELNELVTGENASQYIKQDQQFKNPQTGQFDPAQVRLFISQLDAPRENVEPGLVRKQWLRFEGMLKQNQYQQKYNNLINKAFYIPAWMAEMNYNDQSRSVDFKYVSLPYMEVTDSEVKVTDEDLKKYMDEHASRYKQDDETRKIEYVTFDIVPSAGDSAKTMRELEDRKAEFAKGEKRSDDSMFVKLYSETPFDEVFADKDKLNSPVKDSLFLLKIGSVTGPYLDDKAYKIAKITDRKMISDSLHIRDITISFAGVTSQEAASVKYKFIDSIFKQIDSLKGDFAAFAIRFSDDPASKMRGGDLGWVKQGEKEKSYNDLIFYRAVKGKTYMAVSQKENAFHIVQVLEEKPSKMGVQISYLTKEIVPSPETEKAIYANATNFASENQTTVKFMEAAKRLNVKTVNAIQKDAYSVEGLHSARDLVRWAFDDKRKKGDVSSPFTIEGKHVIAMLESISPKGMKNLEEVRAEVTRAVTVKRKFEILAKKITDTKAPSIEDLAAKLGKTVEEANKVSFTSATFGNVREPKLVAQIFALPVGKLSPPIEGIVGAYAVQPTNINEPAKQADYSMYSYQMKQRLQSKASHAQEVQKKLANVEDNRFDFF